MKVLAINSRPYYFNLSQASGPLVIFLIRCSQSSFRNVYPRYKTGCRNIFFKSWESFSPLSYNFFSLRFLLRPPIFKQTMMKKILKDGKKEKRKTKDTSADKSKFRELDDSRRAMRKIDSKKAKEKGEETPKYKPRGEVPKSKKKEAELKAKSKG